MNKILIVVAVVILGVVAAGGAYFMQQNSQPEDTGEAQTQEQNITNNEFTGFQKMKTNFLDLNRRAHQMLV